MDDSDVLHESFTKIWSTYKQLETTEHPSSSTEYQDMLMMSIKECEQLVHKINELSLFSINENLSEVKTSEIRYLLLPALLGYFTCKMSQSDRMSILTKSKTYFLDFLRLCRLYDISSSEADDMEDDTDNSDRSSKSRLPSLRDAASVREQKIRRYKERKLLDERVTNLYQQVTKPHVDESLQREYFTSLLKQWVLTAREELDLIEEEIPLLEHMTKMKSGNNTGNPPPVIKKTEPLRPFILTKSDLQKKVFGAGYPSLPTYTVEEFYEAQVRAGQMPSHQNGSKQGSAQLSEAAQVEQSEILKEYKVEQDNPEALAKARDWDDWKDDHRRGWGNRKNMG